MSEISKKAEQDIIYVIKYHLEDYGLENLQPARNMAISIAADVKKIMQEEALRNWEIAHFNDPEVHGG